MPHHFRYVNKIYIFSIDVSVPFIYLYKTPSIRMYVYIGLPLLCNTCPKLQLLILKVDSSSRPPGPGWTGGCAEQETPVACDICRARCPNLFGS